MSQDQSMLQANGAAQIVPLPWHEEVRQALRHSRRPLLLVGPPGSGKSTFAFAAALEATGEPPEVIHGNPQTEERHIWADRTLDAQQGLRWVDGPLPRAVKSGRWLLVEEVNQIPPEVLGQLLQLRLDPHQEQTIVNLANGQRLRVPEQWRVILTANPQSLQCFSANRTAAVRALLDGCLVKEVPAMNRQQLQHLLQHRFGQEPGALEAIGRTLTLWERLERARSIRSEAQGISLRALEDAVRLQLAGMPWEEVAQMALVGKFILDRDLYESLRLEMLLSSDEDDEDEEDLWLDDELDCEDDQNEDDEDDET